MAERLLLGLAVLAGYIAAGTVLAVWVRRRAGRGEAEFFVAGGRLGGLLAAFTYAATTYSAFMIVGLVGFSYATGAGALGFELVYYIATVGLLVVFARRVRRMAGERGWISPGEMLADLYGAPWLAGLASLVFLVSLVPYAASQLKGVGEAVAGLGGGSEQLYLAGIAAAALVMIFWSLVAGIWSVAVTDAFQGLWMLVSATMLLLWLALHLSSSGLGPWEAYEVLAEAGYLGLTGFWKPAVFLAFTLPWAFFAATNPQVVQRLFLPRDDASVAAMIRWFAVFGLYYTLLVVAVGLLARAGVEAGVLGLKPERIDQVTPQLLALTHPLLAAAVFTSIVAAAVSTADSIILTLASSASRDIGGIALRLPEEKRLLIGRLAVVVFALIIAAVAAARAAYIVALSVLSSMMLLSLAPATLLAWLGRRGDPRLAAASIVVGPLAVAAALLYLGDPRKVFTFTLLGLPLSAWILVASSALALASVKMGGGRLKQSK